MAHVALSTTRTHWDHSLLKNLPVSIIHNVFTISYSMHSTFYFRIIRKPKNTFFLCQRETHNTITKKKKKHQVELGAPFPYGKVAHVALSKNKNTKGSILLVVVPFPFVYKMNVGYKTEAN